MENLIFDGKSELKSVLKLEMTSYSDNAYDVTIFSCFDLYSISTKFHCCSCFDLYSISTKFHCCAVHVKPGGKSFFAPLH